MGSLSGGGGGASSSTSSSSSREETERQVLLSRLLAAVRGCQARFGGDALATDRGDGGGDREVSELLQVLEAVFAHGFGSTSADGPSTSSFWPLIKLNSGRHELERFYLLRRVTTDAGRCRAWIRAALNERSLERHVRAVSAASAAAASRGGDATATAAMYRPWAFLRDRERAAVLATAAAGLGSVVFALRIDVEELDREEKKGRRKKARPHEVTLDGDDGADRAGERDALQLDFDDVKLRSDSDKTTSAGGQGGSDADDAISVASNNESDAGALPSTNRLTPMKNVSVGALIPVEDDGGQSDEDSLSVGESDYASALGGATPAHSVAGSVAGGRTGSETAAAAAAAAARYAASSVTASSCVSREELKKALLSVMERKDELQSQCQQLRRLLEQEGASAATAKAEAAAERLKASEAEEKLRGKVQSLSRENELLKHQLKKYVGAVQRLREGPQAHETLAALEAEGGAGRERRQRLYVDYHFEASEYEKKLIQESVAEMHGELIEFNEHLQRSLQSKDASIRRLREELVELRGPLPVSDAGGGGGGDGEDGGEEGERAPPPLLHVWIPSVFLSGAPGKTHHVYQVYLRLRDEEWNVYRRYRDFHALHLQLRQQDAAVARFDFPPKKTVGNKAERVVEDRRRRLQAYLRRVVNLVVQTNPALTATTAGGAAAAAVAGKESITALLPFLAENNGVAPSSSSAAATSQRQRWSTSGVVDVPARQRGAPPSSAGKRRSRSQGRTAALFSRTQASLAAAASSQLAL